MKITTNYWNWTADENTKAASHMRKMLRNSFNLTIQRNWYWTWIWTADEPDLDALILTFGNLIKSAPQNYYIAYHFQIEKLWAIRNGQTRTPMICGSFFVAIISATRAAARCVIDIILPLLILRHYNGPFPKTTTSPQVRYSHFPMLYLHLPTNFNWSVLGCTHRSHFLPNSRWTTLAEIDVIRLNM